MPRKKLTEEGVRRLKPPPHGKQFDYYDAHMPGLVLRMNYGGRKTWRALHYVKVTKNGAQRTEPRTHPLGRYPHLPLKEAREAARRFLADPVKALAQAETGSFRQVAENFVKRHVDANALRTAPDIKRCLVKYIYPRWEHRPFRDVRRSDVTTLMDELEEHHGPGQADYCFSIISKLMNWYQSRNDEYVSPVVRGMRRRKIAETARDRKLEDDEIRAVWNACGELGTFGVLVKMLLLTAQRLRKVSNMRWDQLKDGEWHIPKDDKREKGNAGVLKLPKLALDLINAQPRIADNPYVFPAERHDGQAFRSFSHGKGALDKKLAGIEPPWVIHDLRRTARSLMARADVRPDVAERVLGHAIIGVEAVYDRHSYQKEKADALQRLARLIETILNPPKDNVVDMRRKVKSKR